MYIKNSFLCFISIFLIFSRIMAMSLLPEVVNKISVENQELCIIPFQTETQYERESWHSENSKYRHLLSTTFGRSSIPVIGQQYWWEKGKWNHFGRPATIKTTYAPEFLPGMYVSCCHYHEPSMDTRHPDGGLLDGRTPVDSNAFRQACVAYSSSGAQRHTLNFFTPPNGEFKPEIQVYLRPGVVAFLTVHEKMPRAICLINNVVPTTKATFQSMEVTDNKDAANVVVLSAHIPTDVRFAEIFPCTTNTEHSYLALSDIGKLWRVVRKGKRVYYTEQIVRDKTGKEKSYAHIAMNNGLLAVLSPTGDIFVGDSAWKPSPVLMYVDTIPNPEDIIRFSHTGDVEGTANINAVCAKKFPACMRDEHIIRTVSYSYPALFWQYMIQKTVI